ncbi:MAG: bifunctional phosphoribosylaminoimidazolecarboxamide formyltransferase/IMP cyclohydrolase [Chloroflexota bacterium]
MRALLSVADPDGIAELARALAAQGVSVHVTAPAYDALRADGIGVHPATDLTGGAPLPADGVHPAIAAAISVRRDHPDALAALTAAGGAPIDLVVVALRPIVSPGEAEPPLDAALGRIDLTGTAHLALAARNAGGVAAVADARRYPAIVAELRRLGGIAPETRLALAAEALGAIAAHHAAASALLARRGGAEFPDRLALVLEKVRDLGYGENPHQRAAIYREPGAPARGPLGAEVLAGTPPTFNDLLDLDAAWRIAADFGTPTCAIVKLQNPVGLASHATLAGAYRRALDGDPVAAMGAVVALNRVVDADAAEELVTGAYEAVVAPGFDAAARDILAERPGLALLAAPPAGADEPARAETFLPDLRRIDGGYLAETPDHLEIEHGSLRVVTRRRPTLDELTDLLFAWRAVRHVRSNAVVLAHGAALVGIGAGQATRLAAVEIALHRAADRAGGAVLASDAYFPFADAIVLAAERGVTAVIQPGGSVRDEMAVEVADRHHLAMVFTGRRHYRR